MDSDDSISESQLEIEYLVEKIMVAIDYNKGLGISSCNYYFRKQDGNLVDGVIDKLKNMGYEKIKRSDVDGDHVVINW